MRTIIVGQRGITGTTGKFLARALAARYTSHHCQNNYDLAIRWGNSWARVPAEVGLPEAAAISLASDKLAALQALQNAGVRVPDFVEIAHASMSDMSACVPGFVRTRYHHGGSGLAYCPDIATLAELDLLNYSYLIKEINKQEEWRIHIGEWRGVRLTYAQRKLRMLDAFPGKVWNYAAGWRFHSRSIDNTDPELMTQAQKAVTTLGLTFGCVDIVKDGRLSWVLEVNTAPGLKSEPSQTAYLAFFKEAISKVERSRR